MIRGRGGERWAGAPSISPVTGYNQPPVWASPTDAPLSTLRRLRFFFLFLFFFSLPILFLERGGQHLSSSPGQERGRVGSLVSRNFTSGVASCVKLGTPYLIRYPAPMYPGKHSYAIAP